MSNEQSESPGTLLIAHCTLLISHWHQIDGSLVESLHGLLTTRWDQGPFRLVAGNWELKTESRSGWTSANRQLLVTSYQLQVGSWEGPRHLPPTQIAAAHCLSAAD